MISYRMIHDVMPDALDLFLKKMKKQQRVSVCDSLFCLLLLLRTTTQYYSAQMRSRVESDPKNNTSTASSLILLLICMYVCMVCGRCCLLCRRNCIIKLSVHCNKTKRETRQAREGDEASLLPILIDVQCYVHAFVLLLLLLSLSLTHF